MLVQGYKKGWIEKEQCTLNRLYTAHLRCCFAFSARWE
jgi:hypothetical protein